MGILAPTCTYFFGAFRKSTISSSSSFSSFRPATSAKVTLISFWPAIRARLLPKLMAFALAPPLCRFIRKNRRNTAASVIMSGRSTVVSIESSGMADIP